MRFLLTVAVLICTLAALAQAQPALEEIRRRAEQGDAGAQYNLGYLYANGLGVTQDHTEAVKWYRLAAEQGSELKAVCERIEGNLLLDLANLTMADPEGLKVILDLEASGAEIVAASQYIRLLLDREKSS
jgi:TPR repeat protein